LSSGKDIEKHPSFFTRLQTNLFDLIDSYDLRFKGFQFNILKGDRSLRNLTVKLVIIALLIWAFMGFDSSETQFESFFLHGLPKFLTQEIDFPQLQEYWTVQYGKGLHWSALVIYGTMFYVLSDHYWKTLWIHGSRNVILSMTFMLLSVAVFEFFWMFSYYIFQNQPWILSFRWGQVRILYQNLMFIVLGLSMIYVVKSSGKLAFNFDKWTTLLYVATIISICVWYLYGYIFPLERLEVPILGGSPWVNTKMFPQTVYTIDVDITDKIASGEQFFVENDLLHGVNTVTKIFMTGFFTNLFRFKVKKK